MSQATHFETAPEDRIPFIQKLIYGMGAFANNLLAAASGGLLIVLNLALGMNPALIGLLGLIPRMFDAITDPMMGYISDNTRSRWGRRRPYIFCGAILAGLVFALIWQLPRGHSESFYFWFMLVGMLVFFLFYTMFATPWVALGYELTPDYKERTRLMGTQNFIGQFPYLLSPWFLYFVQRESLFDDMVDGVGSLAIMIGAGTIIIGILPAVFLRERETTAPDVADAKLKGPARQGESSLMRNMREFFAGFLETIKSKPFLKLCAATFLIFNGFIMIAAFQFYVIAYYIFDGDTDLGAKYAGWVGTVSFFSTLVVIPIVTWLGTHMGKRRAFYVAIGLSMLGYALKWPCYNPQYPWLIFLPAPLLAFGLGGLFTLMPSMIADVVGLDELETNERREGMFGSIFWWVVKLGQAVALFAGGLLLNWTGFDVNIDGSQAEQTKYLLRVCDVMFPLVAYGLAVWAVASFSITEKRANEVRALLEERRGKSAPAAGAV